ncbi:Ldo16p KNAG_0E01990 [Huiozyma naganishii CBS 8797]|uniref:Outer spore wall protein 5 n=1 Tax=Huiozyma naganishii (strain ATCC MYA-139 / BCRC 22969 / CBS 8797 / KCTC 17520 / NBRC 10181 / NCYC 3082 / Yp74L-3) TaxID=1071383 RepID=J7S7R9_HUIN7|nr:hypothetical protein KNAG_0E01990 [Kazachstania naganishii CBS 8797]CCK70461.1 hypothetical protein KNAG_0E01990 [Kazachstania naganishii CBS 8797]
MALLGIIVYAAAFFALTIASSLLIIPLLVMSFIFATLVIVFGFISNATFKMCQAIIFRVEGILHGIYFHMITIRRQEEIQMKRFTSVGQSTRLYCTTITVPTDPHFTRTSYRKKNKNKRNLVKLHIYIHLQTIYGLIIFGI